MTEVVTRGQVRRAERKAAVREEMLIAARALLVTGGYEALTMRQLAERVNYAPATLYLHFRDKADLTRRLLDQDFSLLTQEMLAVERTSDPVENVRQIAIAYVNFALSHPHTYRLLFMTPGLPDAQETSLRSLAQQGDPDTDGYVIFLNAVAAALAMTDPHERRRDPHYVAQLLWAGLHGAVALRLGFSNEPWIPWCDTTVLAHGMATTLTSALFPKQ